MSCPKKDGAPHDWLKFWPNGKPRSWWRCDYCGKRRRPRHPRLWKEEQYAKFDLGRGMSPGPVIIDEVQRFAWTVPGYVQVADIPLRTEADWQRLADEIATANAMRKHLHVSELLLDLPVQPGVPELLGDEDGR